MRVVGKDEFFAEAFEARQAAFRHTITRRADGPDLNDLVRLVEFLRKCPAVDHLHIGSVTRVDGLRMVVEWGAPDPDSDRYCARKGGRAEEREPSDLNLVASDGGSHSDSIVATVGS